MISKTFKKVWGLSLAATLFILGGCDVGGTKVTELSKEKSPKVLEVAKMEQPDVKEELSKTEQKALEVKGSVEANPIISEVFLDSAKIATNGKHSIVIIGSQNSEFCDLLLKDISENANLKNSLKNDFSSYYLDIGDNKMHSLEHEGEMMNVDTKTLADIYGVTGTPTIIFNDLVNKSILIVPGYMPPKQFTETINFILDKKYEGKDRKDGEIYQTLKDFYIEKGILDKDGKRKDK